MKKLFLLIGIGTFTGAAAQQKDIFDVQRHLQKKIKHEHSFAFSLPKQKIIPPLPFGRTQNKIYSILANGDKVVILPTDNMPCVQPDMRPFLTPVLRPDMREFHTMPNAALPYAYLPGTVPDNIPGYFPRK